MKSFVYAYRSSDGVRHEETMAAPAKEAVFEALRERGIRPIKVIDRGETPAARRRRRIVAGCALGAALGACALGALAWLRPAAESAEMRSLRVQAAAIREKHVAAVTLAGDDCGKALAAVEAARGEAREAFANILSTLPAREQTEAKRLYGELMMLVDDSELQAYEGARE